MNPMKYDDPSNMTIGWVNHTMLDLRYCNITPLGVLVECTCIGLWVLVHCGIARTRDAGSWLVSRYWVLGSTYLLGIGMLGIGS